MKVFASAQAPSTRPARAVQFRPCIDIHKGKVKQIVGSTLKDLNAGDEKALVTNFESEISAGEYAAMYKKVRSQCPSLFVSSISICASYNTCFLSTVMMLSPAG